MYDEITDFDFGELEFLMHKCSDILPGSCNLAAMFVASDSNDSASTEHFYLSIYVLTSEMIISETVYNWFSSDFLPRYFIWATLLWLVEELLFHKVAMVNNISSTYVTLRLCQDALPFDVLKFNIQTMDNRQNAEFNQGSWKSERYLCIFENEIIK